MADFLPKQRTRQQTYDHLSSSGHFFFRNMLRRFFFCFFIFLDQMFELLFLILFFVTTRKFHFFRLKQGFWCFVMFIGHGLCQNMVHLLRGFFIGNLFQQGSWLPFLPLCDWLHRSKHCAFSKHQSFAAAAAARE